MNKPNEQHMNSMFPSNTKGIIFDLDGTLYHIKWYMKIMFALFLFPKWHLLTRYMSIRKNYSGKEIGSGDELLRSLAKDLSKSSKPHNSDVMLSWIINNFYPTFVKVMLYMKGSRPQLNETLVSVKNKGYKLAVLSDFAYIKERLVGLNIPADIFDTLLSSESEGSLKPCAGPFLKITKTWQIAPADIVVVGDKDDTDGMGASNSGMSFLQISDKRAKPKNSSDWSSIRDGLLNLPSLIQ